jgi:hypothetical protein
MLHIEMELSLTLERFINSGPGLTYTYQEILLTNFRCTFLVVSLSLLQSLNPNVDIVFLLFVLQYILIIGNVEVNPGPELINRSSVSDNSISICNINIRSARNKLDFLNNFTDEFDPDGFINVIFEFVLTDN